MQFFETGTEFFVELPATASLQGPAVERARGRIREQLAGAPINQSEGRAVGHEWLRRPEAAPSAEIRDAILRSQQEISAMPVDSQRSLLLIGIGGSALGVQMVSQALAKDPSRLQCLDNADPKGMQELLAKVDPRRTTPIVVTKSGNSAETMSAMKCAQAHWQKHDQAWQEQAIAITGPGSSLDKLAQDWRARFPIWPWVGGRFCVTSPAGLLPLQLLGVDCAGLLRGAAQVDAWTAPDELHNPALALAQLLFEGQAEGKLHSLALMAYRDRLQLLGRYLQQLVMESIGKSQSLDGRSLAQGLSFFGERGSCDQHSILQYLTQGRPDTQTILLECREDDHSDPEQSALANEHLARLLGSYQALQAAQRPAVLLSLAKLDAFSLGGIIAFFERCVGYYAGMANLNAYDQPGVEHGKKASLALMQAYRELPQLLGQGWQSVASLAQRSELPSAVVWRLAMQWVLQGRAEREEHGDPAQQRFRWIG